MGGLFYVERITILEDMEMTPIQKLFLAEVNHTLELLQKLFKSHGLKIEFKIEEPPK